MLIRSWDRLKAFGWFAIAFGRSAAVFEAVVAFLLKPSDKEESLIAATYVSGGLKETGFRASA